jgi:hypothetical protein
MLTVLASAESSIDAIQVNFSHEICLSRSRTLARGQSEFALQFIWRKRVAGICRRLGWSSRDRNLSEYVRVLLGTGDSRGPG